jgi:hypothetical protein
MSNQRVFKRLDRLSPKVAMPLRKLLEAGQLSHEVVELVLDAGELAGDTSKLVAFAAGMVYLQSQSVPVHDVIRMAKRQKRRISLEWSPRRWKEEHDRLSRAEALESMSRDNVTYDLSLYHDHVPKTFPGYLIRTSRRLGMEGLRQRHCVASYHEQVMKGHCAIATVFVDKKRWTVQLISTGNERAPIRIGQVKTRYNIPPTTEVTRKIYDIFGVRREVVSSDYCEVPDDREHRYIENLRRVLQVLREQGVNHVRVSFDGSGDSGSIDWVEFDPPINSDTIRIETITVSREHVDGQWRYARGTAETGIADAIEEITYDYLAKSNVDWYNNDGGFGDLVIDVLEGTVQLDVSVRVTESQSAYSETLNIDTGESVEM